MLKELVLADIILGILNHLVHGDNALGHKVNAVNEGDGRKAAGLKVLADGDRLSEVICHDG